MNLLSTRNERCFARLWRFGAENLHASEIEQQSSLLTQSRRSFTGPCRLGAESLYASEIEQQSSLLAQSRRSFTGPCRLGAESLHTSEIEHRTFCLRRADALRTMTYLSSSTAMGGINAETRAGDLSPVFFPNHLRSRQHHLRSWQAWLSNARSTSLGPISRLSVSCHRTDGIMLLIYLAAWQPDARVRAAQRRQVAALPKLRCMVRTCSPHEKHAMS
jgi:hypothetical protein